MIINKKPNKKQMTKQLNEYDWAEIKTRFDLGETYRSIAQDYGIPHTSIQYRADRDKWRRDLSEKIQDIKNTISDICETAEVKQIPLIHEKIRNDVEEMFRFAKSINNLQKGALNLHSIVLKNTLEKVSTGQISNYQALKLVQMQGLNVKDIAGMTGISKESPQVAIQNNINNNGNDDSAKLVIEYVGNE